jgi:DNA-binding NarL/FixJ family response regulator
MYPQPANLDRIVSRRISVIVADHNPMVPSDIASTLSGHPDVDVVDVCSDGKAALGLIQQFIPDIAIIDVGMSELNVLDIMSRIAANGLKTKVVCLITSPVGYDLTGAIATGVQGILVKGTAPDNIVDCVRDVFHGKRWFPGHLEAAPKREIGHRRQVKPLIRTLTPRQRQIALLVCDGLSNKQLGQQLNLTEGTIKVHLHKIYRKLGVRNRTALSTLTIANRASLKPRRGKRSNVTGQMPSGGAD